MEKSYNNRYDNSSIEFRVHRRHTHYSTDLSLEQTSKELERDKQRIISDNIASLIIGFAIASSANDSIYYQPEYTSTPEIRLKNENMEDNKAA